MNHFSRAWLATLITAALVAGCSWRRNADSMWLQWNDARPASRPVEHAPNAENTKRLEPVADVEWERFAQEKGIVSSHSQSARPERNGLGLWRGPRQDPNLRARTSDERPARTVGLSYSFPW